eukprot:3950032-Prymnesium_polylepis.1
MEPARHHFRAASKIRRRWAGFISAVGAGRKVDRATIVANTTYFLMKPSGGATPFLASSLQPRHRARGYSR